MMMKWTVGNKRVTKLHFGMDELVERRRYGIILSSVSCGLAQLGVTDVSISEPMEKGGEFIFTMRRKK